MVLKARKIPESCWTSVYIRGAKEAGVWSWWSMLSEAGAHMSKKQRSTGDSTGLTICKGHSLEGGIDHNEGVFPTQFILFGNTVTDWPRGVSLG